MTDGIDTSTNSAPRHAQGAQGHTWVACHDMLVCSGAHRTQKWCVRERDEKGPLVAVMLTKDVAHLFAAAPHLLHACKFALAAYADDDTCMEAETLRAAIAKAGGQ
jgi:hypothetical protein